MTRSTLAAPIARGRTAELYDWDAGHVLKLYYAWCPPRWVEHEAHVARVIGEAGIPAPAAGEVLELDGRCGIIYERIAGITHQPDPDRRRQGRGDMVSPAIRLLSGLFHQAYVNRYRALVPDGHADLARWLPVIAAARLDEQIEQERAALLQIVMRGLA